MFNIWLAIYIVGQIYDLYIYTVTGTFTLILNSIYITFVLLCAMEYYKLLLAITE
jgi:hypothetical protein